jgi:1-acyl-sn-glycerol-3-phosphate acyltransferase
MELSRSLIPDFRTALKTSNTHTALAVRLFRLIRAGLHLFAGLLILVCRYRHQPREAQAVIAQRWAEKCLRTLGITLRINGPVPASFQHNTLLISNHISWLDIIALTACTPPRFIAKQEIRHWPLIGWMTYLGGTLFIDRSNRRDASRVNRQMAEALKNGDCLAVFPEGTTSTGTGLLPFKSSLFESAVMAQSRVQPVSIRYLDQDGGLSTAPSYAGDTTFFQSLVRLLQMKVMIAEISYSQPLEAGTAPLLTRFELAEAAHSAIASGLRKSAGMPDMAEQKPACPQVEVP